QEAPSDGQIQAAILKKRGKVSKHEQLIVLIGAIMDSFQFKTMNSTPSLTRYLATGKNKRIALHL
ncbi:MAG TPA: hypothetical protein PK198_20845, partial [Saprospiraceae bacterium]|nr:hypothetical protein [Saprospiraceae bacterium]